MLIIDKKHMRMNTMSQSQSNSKVRKNKRINIITEREYYDIEIL